MLMTYKKNTPYCNAYNFSSIIFANKYCHNVVNVQYASYSTRFEYKPNTIPNPPLFPFIFFSFIFFNPLKLQAIYILEDEPNGFSGLPSAEPSQFRN